MLPMGGAKGAMLALVVEIWSRALTGAALGFEASSFFVDEGNRPRHRPGVPGHRSRRARGDGRLCRAPGDADRGDARRPGGAAARNAARASRRRGGGEGVEIAAGACRRARAPRGGRLIGRQCGSTGNGASASRNSLTTRALRRRGSSRAMLARAKSASPAKSPTRPPASITRARPPRCPSRGTLVRRRHRCGPSPVARGRGRRRPRNCGCRRSRRDAGRSRRQGGSSVVVRPGAHRADERLVDSRACRNLDRNAIARRAVPADGGEELVAHRIEHDRVRHLPCRARRRSTPRSLAGHA